jgi:hypothetical protein
MSHFAYEGLPHEVREDVVGAQRRAWEMLGKPGSWWTGAQRVAIAAQARAARAQCGRPPWLREGLPDGGELLPDAAVEAVRVIAADAHKIDRAWAEKTIAALGDAPYVELAAVVVCVCAIDSFADALGIAPEPLPEPEPGSPDRERLESVTDEGAYVPLQVPWQGPNVGRALSLVPAQNGMFMGLVMAMYGGPQGFFDLVWEDGPLTRPQVELLAARVSAVNECFY